MKPKQPRLKSPSQLGMPEAPTSERPNRFLVRLMNKTNVKKTKPKQPRLETPSQLLLLMSAVSTFAQLQILSKHRIHKIGFQTTVIRNSSRLTLPVTATASLTLPVTGILDLAMLPLVAMAVRGQVTTIAIPHTTPGVVMVTAPQLMELRKETLTDLADMQAAGESVFL